MKKNLTYQQPSQQQQLKRSGNNLSMGGQSQTGLSAQQSMVKMKLSSQNTSMGNTGNISHKRANRSNGGVGSMGQAVGQPPNSQMVQPATGGVHRKNKKSHYIVNTNKLMEFNAQHQNVLQRTSVERLDSSGYTGGNPRPQDKGYNYQQLSQGNIVTAASAANFQAAINNQSQDFNIGTNETNNYSSSSKINFYNPGREVERGSSSAYYKKSLQSQYDRAEQGNVPSGHLIEGNNIIVNSQQIANYPRTQMQSQLHPQKNDGLRSHQEMAGHQPKTQLNSNNGSIQNLQALNHVSSQHSTIQNGGNENLQMKINKKRIMSTGQNKPKAGGNVINETKSGQLQRSNQTSQQKVGQHQRIQSNPIYLIGSNDPSNPRMVGQNNLVMDIDAPQEYDEAQHAQQRPMVLPKTQNVMKRGGKLSMIKENNKNKLAQILDQNQDGNRQVQPQHLNKIALNNLGSNTQIMSRQEAVGIQNPIQKKATTGSKTKDQGQQKPSSAYMRQTKQLKTVYNQSKKSFLGGPSQKQFAKLSFDQDPQILNSMSIPPGQQNKDTLQLKQGGINNAQSSQNIQNIPNLPQKSIFQNSSGVSHNNISHSLPQVSPNMTNTKINQNAAIVTGGSPQVRRGDQKKSTINISSTTGFSGGHKRQGTMDAGNSHSQSLSGTIYNQKKKQLKVQQSQIQQKMNNRQNNKSHSGPGNQLESFVRLQQNIMNMNQNSIDPNQPQVQQDPSMSGRIVVINNNNTNINIHHQGDLQNLQNLQSMQSLQNYNNLVHQIENNINSQQNLGSMKSYTINNTAPRPGQQSEQIPQHSNRSSINHSINSGRGVSGIRSIQSNEPQHFNYIDEMQNENEMRDANAYENTSNNRNPTQGTKSTISNRRIKSSKNQVKTTQQSAERVPTGQNVRANAIAMHKGNPTMAKKSHTRVQSVNATQGNFMVQQAKQNPNIKLNSDHLFQKVHHTKNASIGTTMQQVQPQLQQSRGDQAASNFLNSERSSFLQQQNNGSNININNSQPMNTKKNATQYQSSSVANINVEPQIINQLNQYGQFSKSQINQDDGDKFGSASYQNPNQIHFNHPSQVSKNANNAAISSQKQLSGAQRPFQKSAGNNGSQVRQVSHGQKQLNKIIMSQQQKNSHQTSPQNRQAQHQQMQQESVGHHNSQTFIVQNQQYVKNQPNQFPNGQQKFIVSSQPAHLNKQGLNTNNDQMIAIPKTQNVSYHKAKMQNISKTGGATSPISQSQKRIHLSGNNIHHKKTNTAFTGGPVKLKAANIGETNSKLSFQGQVQQQNYQMMQQQIHIQDQQSDERQYADQSNSKLSQDEIDKLQAKNRKSIQSDLHQKSKPKTANQDPGAYGKRLEGNQMMQMRGDNSIPPSFPASNQMSKLSLQKFNSSTLDHNKSKQTDHNAPEDTPRKMIYNSILNNIKNEVYDTKMDYYKIGKVIGKGAFGKVNLAIHRLTSRFLAVKSINKTFMSDENSHKKVIQEYQILKKVRHPNIVRLYEKFENEQHIVYVMEVCGGGDLLTYVRRRRKLKEDIAKFLFRQIVLGLQYIHSKGVLHRDIKLDNILLTSEGDVKICDFGVSKLIKNKSQIQTEQCGTPAYIAPEVFRGKGYKGYQSDIWGAGVVLYAMLFGTVPFKATNMVELQQQIINVQCSWGQPGEISTEALRFLKKVLEVDPNKRLNPQQIMAEPWIQQTEQEINKVSVFSEHEKNKIVGEFEYYNQKKENNQGDDPFLEQMLVTTQNSLMKNNTTKSVILAPFNSTKSHISDDFFLKDSIQELLVSQSALVFADKCREINRQYMHNNNAELDNGVYNENDEKPDKQPSSQQIQMEELKGLDMEIQNTPKRYKLNNNDENDDSTPATSHPQSVMQSNLASLNTSQVVVDEERVEKMQQLFGYKPQYVTDCIENDELNHATATYFLIDQPKEF